MGYKGQLHVIKQAAEVHSAMHSGCLGLSPLAPGPLLATGLLTAPDLQHAPRFPPTPVFPPAPGLLPVP